MSDDVAEPQLRPELLAGALDALAMAAGSASWKPPLAAGARLEAALDRQLAELETIFGRQLDALEHIAARRVLFELSAPFTLAAETLARTIIEWTGGEMTPQRILDHLEAHLIE